MHRKTSFFLGLIALAFALAGVPRAAAAEEVLFNGRNLDGWKGLPQFWSVVEGAIVGETTAENPSKGNTFLIWQGGPLSDFEISLQVRFRGNNSGLQYRSGLVDEANFVLAGYQADLHPSPDYFGMLYGEKMGQRGIIAKRGEQVEIGADSVVKVVGKVGDGATLTDWEWNTLRLVVVGNRLIHQINGVTTVDVTDDHPESLAQGLLGLQLHAGPPMRVEFKEIKLRRFTGDAGKAALQQAIKSGAGKPAASKAAAPEPAAAASKDRAAWLAGDADLQWIWGETGAQANEALWFRRSFEIPADAVLTSARLYGTCDNLMDLWLNGKKIGSSPDWPEPIEVTGAQSLLRPGKNVIAIRGQNAGGAAAMIFKLEIKLADGTEIKVITTPDWKMTKKAPAPGWEQPDFDDVTWTDKISSRAKIGAGPWGIPNYTTKPGAGGGPAKKSPLPADEITVLDGFKVELVYTVPRDEEGSWVALSKGPGGKLYASDQGDKGIYEISFKGDTATVGKIPAKVSGAMGLTWAFDALYANLSGKPLVRIHDSNGDGTLDAVEELPGATGGGEHGNHALLPGPDGKGLYVVAGNHTNLMEIAGSRVVNWAEDHLLPRQWDARGHARGRLAPGGWIAEFDPITKKYEMFSMGFRNEYDIALNRHGDLFTFDADMEWDLGMPWYRPTRICQVVSGGDFGWRSGTGKWPSYYEDSLPPVLEIGPGSPTGVTFGTGAKFPGKYQEALFALDWTFGTIYAIHLKGKGAGYEATQEAFLHGIPLAVTDAVIGDDGAFYFTTGGRNTQSALYRVTYTKNMPKEEAVVEAPEITAARTTRRQLEAFHGKAHPEAVATALPYLGSGDRLLRHAARVAIESQPAAQWAGMILKAADTQTRITGAVALARTGDPESYRAPLLASLLELDPATLADSQILGLLRAYGLNFLRLGRPDPAEREAIIAALDPLLPHQNAAVNTELVQVLVYLEAPAVIGKTMNLIVQRSAPEIPDWKELASRNPGYGGTVLEVLSHHPPSREIGYAFILRNMKKGWKIDERRQFFTFLNDAAKFKGGASYTGFLANLRDEALGNCTNAERTALADLTGENFNPVPDFTITPPKGPGQVWTVTSAAPHTGSGALKKANFENGRSLFHAVGCAACHRFAGLGGEIGPDLSSLRNKFATDYVLESLIDPSRVISDQYGAFTVTMKSGDRHTGLVVEKETAVEIYPAVNAAEPITVARCDLAKIEQSPVSQMPPGLINGLNAGELSDLIAYLMSGGDPRDKLYGE